jgi:hypothetical protein
MFSLHHSFHVASVCRLTAFQPPGARDDRAQWQVDRRVKGTGFVRGQTGWHLLAVIVVAWVFTASALPSLAIGGSTAPGVLALVDRTVTQDQGAWLIDYRLQHTGKTGVIVTPEEIAVTVEGWVSNSRIASHALPRWSSLVTSHVSDLSAISEVITASDEAHRCRERLVVFIWTENQGSFRSGLGTQPGAKARASQAPAANSTDPAIDLPFSLGPKAIVRVRLRLEHQHILYGDYDPLLAVRAVTLTLGSTPVRDVVPLDREQYLAQPIFTWPEPPVERRDTRHAVSGPDSLHLEAHVPGHQSYRYPERPVRYNTKMRLRFWYLVAAGTEGECHVRVAQFKETPISFRTLNSGGFEQCLKTIGRWTKVDRIIQTESEATTLTLEFKIVSENEVGELWIDDVSMEPMGCELPGGP